MRGLAGAKTSPVWSRAEPLLEVYVVNPYRNRKVRMRSSQKMNGFAYLMITTVASDLAYNSKFPDKDGPGRPPPPSLNPTKTQCYFYELFRKL